MDTVEESVRGLGATAIGAVAAEGEMGDYRCFSCVCRRMENLLEAYPLDDASRRAVMAEVARLYAEEGGEMSQTDFLRGAYGVLARCYPRVRPFWEHKRAMNDRALEAYSLLKSHRRGSISAFSYGLRMALAGACIDFRGSSVAEILQAVDEIVAQELPIDHSELLQHRLGSARRVLYLANRAGEIVFDRFFIKSLSGQEVSYVVNCPYAGYAASGQDADYVDMRGVSQVLANGCNAPSSIPVRLSARAWEAFEAADVVVAKGVSNLESFYPLHDSRLFVLMRVPCAVVSGVLGCPVGGCVVVNPEARLAELSGRPWGIGT